MNTTVIVNLILQAIQAVVAEIATIRSQAGSSDATLDAQTQQLLAANDALYAALKASLALPSQAGTSSSTTASPAA